VTLFLNAVVAGLAIGSVYGMIALSYTVVFNATSVFNVAQGDIVAVGVLLAWLFLDQAHVPQLVSLLLVVVAVVALCLVEDLVAVRRFLTAAHDEGGIGVFIATLAVALILETVNNISYGTRPLADVPSIVGSSPIRVGSVSTSPQLLLAFIALIVITVILELFYRRTWLGTAMRACAEDREVVALRGVNPVRIGQIAFIIAGVVSGITGFILAPIVHADVTVGLTYGLKGFVALAVGGFGSFRGALIGAWVLGIAEQLFDLYSNAGFEPMVGFVLLLVVLAVRPGGLFGQSSVRVV
jgi:branched-chain amino acid transport system permease protein